MENEKRLIDANLLCDGCSFKTPSGECLMPCCKARTLPTVDYYTEEQVAQIIKQADKLAAKANELEKEVVWLKSCLNCKIRNVCPRHCGKVVHGCDHWEYGNNAVEVVHGRWLWQKDGEADYEQYWMCSECKDVTFFKTNYCPNCGEKMDGDGNA